VPAALTGVFYFFSHTSIWCDPLSDFFYFFSAIIFRSNPHSLLHTYPASACAGYFFYFFGEGFNVRGCLCFIFFFYGEHSSDVSVSVEYLNNNNDSNDDKAGGDGDEANANILNNGDVRIGYTFR